MPSIKVSAWSVVSTEGSPGREPSSKLTHMAAARSQTTGLMDLTMGGLKVLAGCWPRIIVPVHLSPSMDYSQHCCRFPQTQQGESRRESKMEASVFF